MVETTQSIVIEEYSKSTEKQIEKGTFDSLTKEYNNFEYGMMAVIGLIWLSIAVLVYVKCLKKSNSGEPVVCDGDETSLLRECEAEDEDILFFNNRSEERRPTMKRKRNRKFNELDKLKIGINSNFIAEEVEDQS